MKTYNSIFVLILFVLCGLSVTETDAQTRRKKTRRTARTQAVQPVQAEVVATSEDIIRQETGGVTINPTTGKPVKQRRKSNAATDAAGTQQQTDSAALSRQVTELSGKLDSMEIQQRALLDLEKLSRAEERAEMLRRQLIDSTEKESELNSKIESLDYQLRPENIERETAIVGSTRPEEVRESRRKMLEKEKSRAREQLTGIQTSRTRLEAAIVTADALVEKLKASVENESNETGAVKPTTQTPNNTRATPDDSDDEDSNPQ